MDNYFLKIILSFMVITLNSSNLELAIDKALNLSASLENIWTKGDLKQKLQNLVFPSGLGYDKSNDRVRTPKVNAIFGSIPILTKEISNIKNGEPIPVNQFSDLVSPIGFEPMTASLEGRCSIQLSYEPVVFMFLRKQCRGGRIRTCDLLVPNEAR